MAFEFAYDMRPGNLTPIKHKLPVAATQTLVAGDAVVMSSGRVVKGGDGAGRVVGVMAQDSDGAAAGTLVDVWIVAPSQVWRGVASADASALVRDGERAYDLNASNEVNIADTTGGSLQIVGIGDSNTEVLVQFTSCFYA